MNHSICFSPKTILCALACILSSLDSLAQDAQPLVTLNIYTDSGNEETFGPGYTYNLTWLCDQYYGTKVREIFGDFSGNGPLSIYKYFTGSDAYGKNFGADFLLGDERKGGDVTLKFNTPTIETYGVYLSKVIIKKCGNRLSLSPITVTVNGVTQTLEPTPTSSNYRDMIFEFPAADEVGSVEISTTGKGMNFTSIEFYLGEPAPIRFTDGTGHPTMQQSPLSPGNQLTLLPIQYMTDGKWATIDDDRLGSEFIYTITDFDGKDAGLQISYEPGQGLMCSGFKSEGLYTVNVRHAAESGDTEEASYLLNLFPVIDNARINGAEIIDGYSAVYDRTREFDDESYPVREWHNAMVTHCPEGATLFYKVWTDPDFNQTATDLPLPEFALAPTASGLYSIPDGMTQYDHDAGINLNDGNTLDLALRKNGAVSPVYSIRYNRINVPTAVAALSADSPVSLRLFNIDGTPASADSRGLLIEQSSDGTVRKIIR